MLVYTLTLVYSLTGVFCGGSCVGVARLWFVLFCFAVVWVDCLRINSVDALRVLWLLAFECVVIWFNCVLMFGCSFNCFVWMATTVLLAGLVCCFVTGCFGASRFVLMCWILSIVCYKCFVYLHDVVTWIGACGFVCFALWWICCGCLLGGGFLGFVVCLG